VGFYSFGQHVLGPTVRPLMRFKQPSSIISAPGQAIATLCRQIGCRAQIQSPVSKNVVEREGLRFFACIGFK
jgi:hypothetical protein